MDLAQQESDIKLLTVNDIQKIFNCGRRQAYELVNATCFPSIKINNKILIPEHKLKDWIDKNIGKQIYI